jgi:superfamily II DNA helicase RecQ
MITSRIINEQSGMITSRIIMNRTEAEALLQTAVNNPKAQFREGQWEAIDALVNRRRKLVVQRTGWGKSSVYFISTRILRDRGAGPTVIVSPLLDGCLMKPSLVESCCRWLTA